MKYLVLLFVSVFSVRANAGAPLKTLDGLDKRNAVVQIGQGCVPLRSTAARCLTMPWHLCPQ